MRAARSSGSMDRGPPRHRGLVSGRAGTRPFSLLSCGLASPPPLVPRERRNAFGEFLVGFGRHHGLPDFVRNLFHLVERAAHLKKPSRSKNYEPEVRSGAERFSERPATERADAALVGHQNAEVSRASAIRERRRASVLTCERGLQSAIVSDDARLMRRWSRSLREAQARLLWAEADLETSEKSVQLEQRR